MITEDKVIEIFCVMDEFCNNFASECEKNLRLEDKECSHRNRRGKLSVSEIMTILVCYHFGSFSNFKHYYLFYVRQHLAGSFPDAVSYNRFVELMPRVFFHMMPFMKLPGFGKCSGISFVDSTMIPVCHNLRRYANRVFKGMATDGKGTMGWCYGFKLHLVHGLRANMKNRLMSMWDKIMLRKRCIIECINDLLKNKANIVHSRHRSIHNFIMNISSALTAYSFFDNKPQALPVHVEHSTQLALF